MDQRLFRTIRQCDQGLNIFPKVVRMWIDGQKINVDRKDEIIGYQEISLASRDLEFCIIFKLQQHRQLRRGMEARVKSNARLNYFGLSRRLQVCVEQSRAASGVILGPTVLGVVSSNDQLQAISEFSLFFIIFLIGFEMNTETLKRHMRHAALLTVTSFVVPLGVSFSVAGFLLPFGLTPDFVVALALAVPSISIISVLVMQYNMIEKESGRIIISSVAVTDILAFIILVAVSSSIPNTAEVVIETALFIVAFVLVDWVLNYRPKMVRGFLGRVGGWAKREDIAYAALIVVGLTVAAIFQGIGLSYIIGAFFAGAHSPRRVDRPEGLPGGLPDLSRMNRALFIPFFFGFRWTRGGPRPPSSYRLLPSWVWSWHQGWFPRWR